MVSVSGRTGGSPKSEAQQVGGTALSFLGTARDLARAKGNFESRRASAAFSPL